MIAGAARKRFVFTWDWRHKVWMQSAVQGSGRFNCEHAELTVWLPARCAVESQTFQ